MFWRNPIWHRLFEHSIEFILQINSELDLKKKGERYTNLHLPLSSGDDQYLEHLLASLEVLESILQNDNEDIELQ